MKTVDTKAYLSVLKELVEAGETVQVPIRGNSMAPFLRDSRDRILFRKPERPLRRGDMVFFRRPRGEFVMHRIWKITPAGVYLIGDGQVQAEGPLPESCIFARVFAAVRKGKTIGPKNVVWQFYEKVWIRAVPLRRWIFRVLGARPRRGGV